MVVINYGPPIDVYVPGILLANGSQDIVRKRVFNSQMAMLTFKKRLRSPTINHSRRLSKINQISAYRFGQNPSNGSHVRAQTKMYTIADRTWAAG